MKTFIVPLDGSPLSERALPYAASIAQAAGGRLLLLRAVGAEPTAGEHSPEAQAARSELTAIADQVYGQGLAVDSFLIHKSPTPAILDAAREWVADLFVMSTHGRSGLGRWSWG